MEMKRSPVALLDMFTRPAFYAADGRIIQCNAAAAALALQVGDEVQKMLSVGAEEYREFQSGCLYLPLTVGNRRIDATIVAQEDRQLFLLEQDTSLSELRALSLAAQQLRDPLTGMMAAADGLLRQQSDPVATAQFNRRLYQLLRMVSNMSDAVGYCQTPSLPMEQVEICGFLEEILRKAQQYLLSAGLHLHYTLPNATVFVFADREKLERTVYNLLANAARHSAPGDGIDVVLSMRKRLYLSVSDSGRGGITLHADLYERYLRAPSVSDGVDGIGLGMVLIRATAALHGGTVLIDRPDGKGTRVTMSLDIRQDRTAQIRSPVFYPDYAGERDHCLQELADVLPAELYAKENLL